MVSFCPYFCTPKKGKVDLVAQLVEHNTFNVGAQGSNPCGITQNPSRIAGGIFCFPLSESPAIFPAFLYTGQICHALFQY